MVVSAVSVAWAAAASGASANAAPRIAVLIIVSSLDPRAFLQRRAGPGSGRIGPAFGGIQPESMQLNSINLIDCKLISEIGNQ